ncbi:MAG: hypothetical protein OHK0052_23230 [Anaerolineales bacterium]
MENFVAFLVTFLTLVMLLVGLLGLIIPIFPGMVVMWLATLIYGLVAVSIGFDTFNGWLFGLITVLMLVGTTVDNVIMGAGARQTGAAWRSIILASVAGLLGTFVLPPIGGLIAAPVSLYFLEYRRTGDKQKARETVKGLAIGFGLTFVVRFFIGLMMIFFWGVWVFTG